MSISNFGVTVVVGVGPQGPAGPTGQAGPGVAAGGTTGQTLVKASNADYDTEWSSAGSGTVTSISVTTANGVSGTVATPTTTPAITLSLGAITPSSVAASGTVTGSNLSGTNTGDQTITLTGDVTGTGTGSFATTIANNAVTNAKMAQMAAHTYKGNNTGSATEPVDITATQLTADLNTFTDSLKGLAPASGGGSSNYLRADGTWAVPPSGTGTVTSVSVTSANGVSGTVTNPTTTPAISLSLGAITPSSVAASGNVTGANLSGTNTGDQTITLTGGVTGSGTGSFATTVVTNANLTGPITSVGNATTITNSAVTYAKIQNVSATDKLLGRSTAGAGVVEEITCTPFARTILDDATQADVQNTVGLGAIGKLASLDCSMQVGFGDQTNVITAGMQQIIARATFGMTIVGWTMEADTAGSIVIDVWKDTYANSPPTVADSITGSAKPTLSGVIKNTSTTLTGWTTTINKGDAIIFNVDSASTVKQVSLVIYGTRTT